MSSIQPLKNFLDNQSMLDGCACIFVDLLIFALRIIIGSIKRKWRRIKEEVSLQKT